MSTSSSGSAAPLAAQSTWVRQLWAGRGPPAIHWRALISAVVAALLSGLLYNASLATLRWAMPLKLVGFICLLLAAGTIVWFGRASLAVLLQLGIRRLIVFLLILYLIAVVIVGIFVPTRNQRFSYWFTTAAAVARWPITGISTVGHALIAAPGAIRFAATGERALVRLPGVEWSSDVPPTPIVANMAVASVEDTVSAAPAADVQPTTAPPSSERPLQVGDPVRVVGTDGAALRARSASSTTAQIVARFPAGSVLRITDGPQTADGYTWWRVKGEQGEGWCAAAFLALTE
jgi:Bacterial SH3 domain